MDPLTHTLFGWTLSESGMRRLTALATPTLILGANLPDLDAFAYVFGGDDYWWRRGWSHGVLAMAILPLVLTGIMLATARLLRRRRPPDDDAPTVRPGMLLLLSYVSVWSHPVLDWLNTYGVRFLMPFDGTWFYGDALYIVDPWVWLLLGGPLFLSHSERLRSKLNWTALAALASLMVLGGMGFGHPAAWLWIAWLVGLALWRLLGAFPASGVRRRRARAALATAVVYAGLLWTSSKAVEARLRVELPMNGLDVVEMMVSPVVAESQKRLAVVSDGESYHFVDWNWLDEPRWTLADQVPILPVTDDALAAAAVEEAVAAACAARCVRGIVNWIRMPFYEIDETENGRDVYMIDARYVRRRSPGFAVEKVSLDAAGRALCP